MNLFPLEYLNPKSNLYPKHYFDTFVKNHFVQIKFMNAMTKFNLFPIQMILACQKISFLLNKNGDRCSTNILVTKLEQKPSDYVPFMVIPFIYQFQDLKMNTNFIKNTLLVKLYGSIYPWHLKHHMPFITVLMDSCLQDQ